MAIFVAQIDFNFPCFPILYGLFERATSAAETTTVLVDMLQEVVETVPSHRFCRGVTGKSFRALVPIRDGSISIHEIHAIVKIVEESLIERAYRIGRIVQTEVG